jgi:Integrase zinc binding domain
VVRTDHHPLRYLQTQRHLSKRQVRWLDALAEYDYTIKYLAGNWNVVADSLSRLVIGRSTLCAGEYEESDTCPLLVGALSMSQILPRDDVLGGLVTDYMADASMRQEYIRPQKYRKVGGLLYDADGKLVVPDGLTRLVLLHDAHDAVIAGNLCIDKTYSTLRRHFVWPGMRSKVAAYVGICDRCQRD